MDSAKRVGQPLQFRRRPRPLLRISVPSRVDYNWFERLTRQGVYFLTRLKTNADILEVEDRPLPPRKGLVRDQIICMTQQAAESDAPPMMPH